MLWMNRSITNLGYVTDLKARKIATTDDSEYADYMNWLTQQERSKNENKEYYRDRIRNRSK